MNKITNINKLLEIGRSRRSYDIYKFIGDGWIILFEDTVKITKIIDTLVSFKEIFLINYYKYIEPLLEIDIGYIGITAGIDIGELFVIELGTQIEYVGRALNIASRLQNVISTGEGDPSNKILISNKCFSLIEGYKLKDSFRYEDKKRKLKNIVDDQEFRCKMIYI